ncbi:ribosome maturation factor RimP [Ruminiclostridium sufflavum DSM 19573]|uniref:Ribosome maturation factor RimP n=1 Tax=Ruminiclostridium sufflavum DSM 19573 TaxID=1121337 RepID=A0A318XN89_9FIRM|nr:ribosome maturation factor RimP [Ruminiclostridium sufflavum]PYG88409.1 ribosome maturation factor RimP [Ruminiclostridium sufflavum DSM 19573]
MKINIQQVITELAAPIAENLNYELVDVEFVKEGANWYLRIYIDKPGGIGIDDCQIVSEKISDILDKKDPIEQSYYLEVSSPGLERPLKTERDFIKYKGELVELKVFQPVDGKKIFEGELVGLIDNKIVINQEGNTIEFEKNKVAIVKRAVKF